MPLRRTHGKMMPHPDVAMQVNRKINEAEGRLKRQGFTTLTAVEQELTTTATKEIDVNAMKASMKAEAGQRLLTAKTEDERMAAQRILEALPHAQDAEHLFNIDVYDRMRGKVEHRGSPALYEEGYYDLPGVLEFRTIPQPTVGQTIDVHNQLVDSMFASAKKFGRQVEFLNEQTNMSVWKDGKNLTSIPAGGDKALSGRILMGMLDTSEDVWPLRPHHLPRLKLRYDRNFPVYAGPAAKGYDSIRVVNYDDDPSSHHYEQCGYYLGGIVGSIPYRMLMMLDGVERGIANPVYDKDVVPIKALCVEPKDWIACEESGLENTFRACLRLSGELDSKGHIGNADNLFRKLANGTGTLCGDLVTQELMGTVNEQNKAHALAFLKAIRFDEKGMHLPQNPEFSELSQRVALVETKPVKIYDSVRFSGPLVLDGKAEEQRTAALRQRFGNDVVDAIAATTEKIQPPPEEKKRWLDFIRPKKPAEAETVDVPGVGAGRRL